MGKFRECLTELSARDTIWSNFSSFSQYFQYISNFKSPITYIYLLNVVLRIIFFSQFWKSDMSRYGYLEVFQRVPWNSR